jgi:hypothetical protein
VKTIAIISLLMLGSAAIAQTDNTAWIKDCGSINANNFGTGICDPAEMAVLFKSLDVAYFDGLNTGMDNLALALGYSILGAVLDIPEVQQGKCSELGYALIMQAGEVLNSMPPPARGSDPAIGVSLANVLDAGAAYAMRGCE